MKKLITILFLSIALMTPTKQAQALDAKSKAFLIMCTYGTVGGALLGFASLSFGTNSRAIAQGASLGLYAGIAFGSYVIMSHKRPGEIQQPERDGYNDGQDPYYEGDGYGNGADQGGYGAPPPAEDNGGGFFGSPQRFMEIQNELSSSYRYKNKKGRNMNLPLYINFYNTSF